MPVLLGLWDWNPWPANSRTAPSQQQLCDGGAAAAAAGTQLGVNGDTARCPVGAPTQHPQRPKCTVCDFFVIAIRVQLLTVTVPMFLCLTHCFESSGLRCSVHRSGYVFSWRNSTLQTALIESLSARSKGAETFCCSVSARAKGWGEVLANCSINPVLKCSPQAIQEGRRSLGSVWCVDVVLSSRDEHLPAGPQPPVLRGEFIWCICLQLC